MSEQDRIYGFWIRVSTDVGTGDARIERINESRSAEAPPTASLLIPAQERDHVADALSTFRWDERFAVTTFERGVLYRALRDCAAGTRSFIARIGLGPTPDDHGLEEELAVMDPEAPDWIRTWGAPLGEHDEDEEAA